MRSTCIGNQFTGLDSQKYTNRRNLQWLDASTSYRVPRTLLASAPRQLVPLFGQCAFAYAGRRFWSHLPASISEQVAWLNLTALRSVLYRWTEYSVRLPGS
jgi:hypothetical protein